MRKEDFVKFITQQTLYGQLITAASAEEQWHQLSRHGCYLCGGPQSFVAAWVPENSVEYGGIDGKLRLIWYSLCEDHAPSEEVAGLVEIKIINQLTPLNAVGPENSVMQ